MKIIFTLLMIMLFTSTLGKTLVLSEVGKQKIQMTYLIPDATNKEDARVEFELFFDSQLAYNTAASAICVNTEDSSYTIKSDGSNKAFGISFICTLTGGCTAATQLVIAFYGSTVTYNSGTGDYIWTAGDAIDLSAINIGSREVGTAVHVTTRYGMSTTQISNSHIPQISKASYLKCFTSFGGSMATMNVNINLKSWTTTNKEFIVTEKEFTCEKGINCPSTGGESGGIHFAVPIALLSAFSMVFLLF